MVPPADRILPDGHAHEPRQIQYLRVEGPIVALLQLEKNPGFVSAESLEAAGEINDRAPEE